MMNRCLRFNIYLVLGMLLGLGGGCVTGKASNKKPLSTLRFHQETNPDPMGRTKQIAVFRDHPVNLTINQAPFLTEANVKQAKVIETPGGFALSIQFNHEGAWLFEQFTAATRGKRVAVFSQFMNTGEHKLNSGRWLAAPLIHTHIADGLFAFTPDATREETERIALGLNDVAAKLQTGKEVNW